MNVPLKDGYFFCFNRLQQDVISAGHTQGRYHRVSNRCFTDVKPTMKGQTERHRRSMNEAEAAAVIKLTGHKCFLQETYV